MSKQQKKPSSMAPWWIAGITVGVLAVTRQWVYQNKKTDKNPTSGDLNTLKKSKSYDDIQ